MKQVGHARNNNPKGKELMKGAATSPSSKRIPETQTPTAAHLRRYRIISLPADRAIDSTNGECEDRRQSCIALSAERSAVSCGRRRRPSASPACSATLVHNSFHQIDRRPLQ
jgi:hypothetical protein